MLKNGRPYHLPQLNFPYEQVLEKLDDENIGYEFINIIPDEDDGIKPSQAVVFGDDISGVDLDESKPIWVAENNICDGHHRYFKGLFEKRPVMGINLKCSFKDACRVLNKIQDIHEYEESQGIEEVESQDVINYYNDNENQFLESLDEDNESIRLESPSFNNKTVIGYRNEQIKENSVVGNFFTINPIDGYDKYEIEFDNLLDTNALGLVYKDSQSPTDILAKIWFPYINFEKISTQHNLPSEKLKCKAIAEKAIRMGYDGIKYGDSIIQGLK